MFYRQAAKKLAEMNDRRQALELNRVVKNLYRLFDDHPPARIESYIECLFRSTQKEIIKNDFSHAFASVLLMLRQAIVTALPIPKHHTDYAKNHFTPKAKKFQMRFSPVYPTKIERGES